MAYNNGFPMGYQPYYPQYGAPTQSQQIQQPQTNGIIWVQGEAGAKSYLVAPNNTVQLWDSETQTIYLKSADASGMPSMKILDYTIRSNSPTVSQNTIVGQNTNTGDTATRQDINALQVQIDAIKQQISKIGESHHESIVRPNSTARTAEQPTAEIPAI